MGATKNQGGVHSVLHSFDLEVGSTCVRVCPRTGKIQGLLARSREWLAPAPEGAAVALAEGHQKEASRFTIHEAWGADECYPSVGGLSGFSEAAVRDHGEIWGRTCVVDSHGASHHHGSWTLPMPGSPVLRRKLLLEEIAGMPRLRVELDFPWRLPFGTGATTGFLEGLYAFHALFLMETGSRLSFLNSSAQEIFQGVCPSPAAPCAYKFYMRAASALLVHPDSSACRLTVLGSEPGHFGIWWCNNGWGDGREHRVAGLEPTTHLSDGPLFDASNSDTFPTEKVRRFAFQFEFPQ